MSNWPVNVRVSQLSNLPTDQPRIRTNRSNSTGTEPRRARPIAPVLPGGKLFNGYRGQLDPAGRPATPGMISVGDAVCTTTPLAGRGVTLALAQARALIRALDQHGTDIDSATIQFD
ncbi:MAG: hypothetical protein QOI90_1117, partial [Mycobacterium sp.]|nr:hypothetical protein [Mycobacterium sp.]